ncbi:MAG: hypothetical protein QGG64_17905 [Candidatus Latescibacteria bacterium]|nr:hypothetical protein [Candidatus Latescibacterota bacterium]
MNAISTTDAANKKGVTRQAIIKAIDRGDIDGTRVSNRTLVVWENEKYEEWQPNTVRQAAGQAKRRK